MVHVTITMRYIQHIKTEVTHLPVNDKHRLQLKLLSERTDRRWADVEHDGPSGWNVSCEAKDRVIVTSYGRHCGL